MDRYHRYTLLSTRPFSVGSPLSHFVPFISLTPTLQVCKEFNYFHYHQKKVVGKSVAAATELAKEILTQWRLKAALHRTGAVFIELGDDFAYSLKEQTDGIYSNYKVMPSLMIIDEARLETVASGKPGDIHIRYQITA